MSSRVTFDSVAAEGAVQNMNFAKESTFVFFVDGDIQLHINRQSHSVAIAHLYDKNLKRVIEIPPDFVVYDLTNNCTVKRLSMHVQRFALCWTDDYVFTYRGQEIANIKNVRMWEIRSERFVR